MYRPVGALVVLVAVHLSVLGLYLPPVFKSVLTIKSTPDDHFTAGPHCRVISRPEGALVSAGGCPSIRAGIVSPAVFKIAAVAIHSAPDDHFVAGPDRRVKVSAQRAR